eukprot:5422588-Alexandrium_andersonii.AAC.1
MPRPSNSLRSAACFDRSLPLNTATNDKRRDHWALMPRHVTHPGPRPWPNACAKEQESNRPNAVLPC